MTAVLPVRRPGAALQLPPAGDASAAGSWADTTRQYLGLVVPWLVRGLLGLAIVAFAVLAVPGAACMLLLFTLKRHSDATELAHGSAAATDPVPTPVSTIVKPRALSARFYAFATSCALGTLGLMTFGVISFHLDRAAKGLIVPARAPFVSINR